MQWIRNFTIHNYIFHVFQSIQCFGFVAANSTTANHGTGGPGIMHPVHSSKNQPRSVLSSTTGNQLPTNSGKLDLLEIEIT